MPSVLLRLIQHQGHPADHVQEFARSHITHAQVGHRIDHPWPVHHQRKVRAQAA